MANPAPTINQINAFNATQGTTIDFNIIGGTELIRSNRIYIYDLSDNSLICTHLYVSTESIHELPANTDGSIVYESGKSSADFVNGAQYYAQIQTYTDTAGTQGGSGLSVAKIFWCLVNPTLTITTIPSTISTTSYNISATYTDTSASVVSNIIQQYQFNLYSATGSLLQSSGVVVGSGTQQGTSDVYDISYNFTGLNVGSSYYVTVDVTTTQGMSVNAQSNTFTVSIDTPTLGEATVVNNACDGYISVTSNLSGEYGGSGSGEIVLFETDSEDIFTKLQVDLEPTQEGSGNPSPSNVRPIRGHSGVTVYDSPTQNAEDGKSYTQDFNVSLTPTSTDTTPYSFKAVGDVYGDRLEDKIVGGTVAWNQMIPDSSRNYTNTSETDTESFLRFMVQGISPSTVYVSKDFYTSTGEYSTLFKTSSSATGLKIKHNGTVADLVMYQNTQVPLTANYVYMVTANIKAVDAATIGGVVVQNLQFFDLTQMFGSTIADYIYSLEQATAGAGVAWFKKLFPKDYYEYNAGELLSVEGLSAHVMRDADNNVIGNYPLDSSLALRGIPKLDASNNLYYDGDEYTSDGKVKRKYGVVVLNGSEPLWGKSSSALNGFYIPMNIGSWQSDGYMKGYAHVIVLGYTYTSDISTYYNNYGYVYTDATIAFNIDPAICGSTVEEFKTWLASHPITVVYELATPTTETAQAYTNPQIVSKYGTIEYVTNSIVPVGHNTTYLTRDIFGGYVDLVSGTLVVTHGYVDLGTLTWGYQSSNGLFYSSAFPSCKNNTTNLIFSAQEWTPKASEFEVRQTDKSICKDPNGRFYVHDTLYSTAEEFQTAMSGSMMCYELATPQTYQLTPQQVDTLVGTNNVWSEQGNIELSYHIPITNLLVKRQDVDDVSGGWLTLYSQPISQASDMDFTFIDFLNQYGKTYKYALVPLLTQTQSGVEVEVEGGYTVSNEVQSVFDGVFIADSTGSQKCKANVGYGNVDMNQVVGSITPIGAKYPIIITNSHNQYHNGSISGTIVPDDYYFNGNLSRIDMVKKRNELEQFLTNKRVKVIKDWNGNIWLVMIVGNVSCTFNNNYGMGIVSFSTNWTEVGDPTNQQDLQATGLINVGGV